MKDALSYSAFAMLKQAKDTNPGWFNRLSEGVGRVVAGKDYEKVDLALEDADFTTQDAARKLEQANRKKEELIRSLQNKSTNTTPAVADTTATQESRVATSTPNTDYTYGVAPKSRGIMAGNPQLTGIVGGGITGAGLGYLLAKDKFLGTTLGALGGSGLGYLASHMLNNNSRSKK